MEYMLLKLNEFSHCLDQSQVLQSCLEVHFKSVVHCQQKVFYHVCMFFPFQEQMQAKSELSASNKSAQNSVDRLIKFIELVQSL